MKKDTLEAYKKAVQRKFEEEKLGNYSHFLINPSRAKLRELCTVVFKEEPHSDDYSSFRRFFNFDFNAENSRELKDQTDKFRPIETFLKRETDLNDISGVDLAAVLVNFNPRPFQRFLKETAKQKEEPVITLLPNTKAELTEQNPIPISEVPNPKYKASKPKQNLIWIVIGITAFFSTAYTLKDLFFPKKECMQWQKDHYEALDCGETNLGIGTFNSIEILNEQVMRLKKIKVNENTVFFKNNRPVIWYCKQENGIDFFNSYGFHPESGKPLKPVSRYIINKYIKVE